MAITATHHHEGSHTLRLLQVPSEKLSDPAYQAYLVLRTAFVVAPILFGVDKFFNWMTFWPKYLWIGFPHFLSVTPQSFMYGVGVIEIVAGLGVLVLPRLAPYVVAGWLGGIITNEIIKSIAIGGHTQVFWDIALRDLGLMIAAFALARLAAKYAPRRLVGTHRS
ncbi:MAG: hypothetical protein M0Z42_05800 [Actinomycetota bacterium]|jgi:hypothetical protein|nr:hypothetical protein [Actinomycetota bacterium]